MGLTGSLLTAITFRSGVLAIKLSMPVAVSLGGTVSVFSWSVRNWESEFGFCWILSFVGGGIAGLLVGDFGIGGLGP